MGRLYDTYPAKHTVSSGDNAGQEVTVTAYTPERYSAGVGPNYIGEISGYVYVPYMNDGRGGYKPDLQAYEEEINPKPKDPSLWDQVAPIAAVGGAYAFGQTLLDPDKSTKTFIKGIFDLPGEVFGGIEDGFGGLSKGNGDLSFRGVYNWGKGGVDEARGLLDDITGGVENAYDWGARNVSDAYDWTTGSSSNAPAAPASEAPSAPVSETPPATSASSTGGLLEGATVAGGYAGSGSAGAGAVGGGVGGGGAGAGVGGGPIGAGYGLEAASGAGGGESSFMGEYGGDMLSAAATIYSAYNVYNQGQHGVQDPKSTMQAGMAIGSFWGPVGMAVGAAIGYMHGELAKSLNRDPIVPWKKPHKTTRQNQQERWGRFSPGVQEIYAAVHPADDSGVWADGKYAGERWEFGKAVDRARENPVEFIGMLGNFETFGEKWAGTSQDKQEKIVSRLIGENLYKDDKGDVIIFSENQARANEIYNEVMNEGEKEDETA